MHIVCSTSKTQEGRISLSSSPYFLTVLPTLPTSTLRLYLNAPGFNVIIMLSGVTGEMIRRGEGGEKDAVKGLVEIVGGNKKMGAWGQ